MGNLNKKDKYLAGEGRVPLVPLRLGYGPVMKFKIATLGIMHLCGPLPKENIERRSLDFFVGGSQLLKFWTKFQSSPKAHRKGGK